MEEVPSDEGGFWLDLADLARAGRIGEVARCEVRTTDQQVGCERRVLTPGARGGRRSTGRASQHRDHTEAAEHCKFGVVYMMSVCGTASCGPRVLDFGN